MEWRGSSVNNFFEVTNPLFEWRGPAPFYFVAIDEADSVIIKSVAKEFTYGWGILYATVLIESTAWTTALIPKDRRYLIPFKDAIRRELEIELDDLVSCEVSLGKNLKSR
jgi:hypothetical protein